MSEPSVTAVKTLFAHSRNKCFFERCEEDLTKAGWRKVNGEVAHIKGEKSSAARYDASQSESDRQGYDNLMLLCPKHHKLVDYLEPDEYPPERLSEMRERHLAHEAESEWITDEQAEHFALLAIEYFQQGQEDVGLQIINAKYGAEDKFTDVTDQLRARVRDDRLEMSVTNDSMGGDPIENVVKALELTYRLDGVLKRVEVSEGSALILPPPP